MNIYDDYFGNWKNWPKDAIPISICRFPPSGYKGLKYKDVAPEEWLLEAMKTGNASKEFYTKVYLKQLEQIGKEKILDDLSKLSKGKDVILLCYEAPGDFCHRHLLKSFLGGII